MVPEVSNRSRRGTTGAEAAAEHTWASTLL